VKTGNFDKKLLEETTSWKKENPASPKTNYRKNGKCPRIFRYGPYKDDLQLTCVP